jgi:hypothetical protein
MTLEQVLADAREEAAILRRNGHVAQSATLDRFVSAVLAAAEDYLTWLSEPEARLRSGYSTEWLRGRFARLQSQGLAKMDGKRRMYRAVGIPQRPNLEAARMAGRRAAG